MSIGASCGESYRAIVYCLVGIQIDLIPFHLKLSSQVVVVKHHRILRRVQDLCDLFGGSTLPNEIGDLDPVVVKPARWFVSFLTN